MEITTDQLAWDSENIAIWRAFLTTPTGQRLIPKLAEQCPALLEEGEANKISIRSGKVLGFQESLKQLLSLAVPVPEIPKRVDSHPPLEDDDAHHDGQKFNE